MGFRFRILESSSAGNCGLLESTQCRILVDAGLSCRRIGQKLEACGLRLEDLDAVLITHEHNDHCQGLRGLSRFADLPIFANADTAQALKGKYTKTPHWQIFPSGATFTFADLRITSFSIPHDAYDPVGFVISSPSTNGDSGDLFHPLQSMAWVNDLGYIPNLVRERVRGVDLLVLEANHDIAMLDNDTRRPWSTKQRIRGRHGHLSNDAAREFLAETAPTSTWREVCLSHLSRDCNHLDRIQQCFANGFPGTFTLSVVDPASQDGTATLHAVR